MISSAEITPGYLRNTRRSSNTRRYLETYESARLLGNSVLVKACSDSRLVFPMGVGEIRTIAGGGPNSPHNAALLDPNFPVIAVVNHFDSDTVKPGSIPGDCGGREGKASLEGSREEFDEGTLKFLAEHVWSVDLVKQTVIGASFTSVRARGKPTLAAAMDHRSLQTMPLGYVSNETTISKVPVYQMMASEYFPVDTYRNGIPTIRTYGIDDRLVNFLDQCGDTQQNYAARYDLKTIQKSQSPETVILTTELRSPRYRFQEAFERPGSFFQISLALADPDNSVEVDAAQKKVSLDQVDYPRNHFPIKTIIVETRSINTSAHIAEDILNISFMEKWLQGTGNRILVAETTYGMTNYAEIFHPGK